MLWTQGAAAQQDADAVMRQAIAMAPFYLNQVQGYESDVFLKGSVRLGELPGELKQQYNTPARRRVADWVFLVESHNRVTFTAPNRYEQQVLSVSSTLPENMKPTEAVKLVTTNIYDPKSSDHISPLDPKAFSHYNFSHEGLRQESERLIHRIRIRPKKVADNVVSGIIDIVDGTWQVRSFDFRYTKPGGEQQFVALYEEVEPDVFLPSTYDMHMNMMLFGVKAFAHYESTSSYRNVSSSLRMPVEKTQAEKIPLEQTTLQVAVSDTLPFIPSLEESSPVAEVQVYESPAAVISVIPEPSSQTLSNNSQQAWDFFNFIPEYNFVDGFRIGDYISFERSFQENRHKMLFAPSIHYLVARKKIAWQMDAAFRFGLKTNTDSLSHIDFSLSGGDISADFSNEGESRLMNSLSSLLFGVNRIYFYRKKFIEVKNSLTLSSGISMGVNFLWVQRENLGNKTDFNFVRRPPAYNSPLDNYTLPDNTVRKFTFLLAYTPADDLPYPSFSFNYNLGEGKKGMFEYVEATLSQSTPIPQLNARIEYLLNGGYWIIAKGADYPDYKHFRANDWYMAGNSSLTAFHLLDNYVYATHRRWLQAHLEYNSTHLLFSRIPALANVNLSETIHLRTLQFPEWNHSEAGYSFSFGNLVRIGIYAALEEGSYDGIGFCVEIPMNR
jgi:ribulose bisphosphate carboxylase small subunit